MKKYVSKVNQFIVKVQRDHVSAYAAQSAFFMVLSLIPIILLLLTMIQYTPLTKTDIIEEVYQLFPKTIRSPIISIINEVYEQSMMAIPVTIIVALWSAGRAVLAIANGLNSIHREFETRNYVYLRIRSAIYTVLFIVVVILSLLLLGFGNSIGQLVNKHLPMLDGVMSLIIEIRTIGSLLIITLLCWIAYRFLPIKHVKNLFCLPGAIVSALGWAVISLFISLYVDIFKGFTNMYGSLTTIILIMLWLYFCMYMILIGEEINVYMEEKLDRAKDCDKMEKNE